MVISLDAGSHVVHIPCYIPDEQRHKELTIRLLQSFQEKSYCWHKINLRGFQNVFISKRSTGVASLLGILSKSHASATCQAAWLLLPLFGFLCLQKCEYRKFKSDKNKGVVDVFRGKMICSTGKLYVNGEKKRKQNQRLHIHSFKIFSYPTRGLLVIKCKVKYR